MRFIACLAVLASSVSGHEAWDSAVNLAAAQGDALRTPFAGSAADTVAARDTSSSPYLNERSRKFAVDGTRIPEVSFDVGESYAGLLPISNKSSETRQLFFWFFPSQEATAEAKDEIVIWLQGGGGCSSLSGLLQENGPFLWQSGTKAPIKNPYSWSRLTNMVWIEQPVGTGYDKGTPDIANEEQLAQEFMGFWKNFVKTFNLRGRKIYITGESAAGYYVPYIANSFLEANDTNNFNVKGIALNNPIIGDFTLQIELAILPFARYWSNLLDLSSEFLDMVQKKADVCGYTDYFSKFLSFPPPKAPFADAPEPCGLNEQIMDQAIQKNPCFNPYRISDMCPFTYGHLGIVNPGDYLPAGAEIYFNRTDVKRAINAPLDSNWTQCKGPVFVGDGDQSLASALSGTLTNVIDKTRNVVIGGGELDFVVVNNGTLLVLQNTTWGGQNGFDSRPNTPFFIPNDTNTFQGALGGHGNVGIWREERGLTWYTIRLAGHTVPGHSLTGGYRVLQKLLGRIKDFSSTAPL